jgi:hypothetical protein
MRRPYTVTSRRVQLTALHPQHSIARCREPRIVRRDNRRELTLPVHLAKQIMERVSGVLVEIAGRLVGEEQRRTHDQRTCDGDTLLFAAGQHPRPMFETFG